MKKLIIVFVLLGVVAILVVLRMVNRSIFKQNAGDVIAAIESRNTVISESDLNDSYMLVNLDADSTPGQPEIPVTVKIPFENLLEKQNLEQFRQANLNIALYSNDQAIAAKAFTLLNQLGIQNLFIIDTDSIGNETFQYEFQPDTLIRPE